MPVLSREELDRIGKEGGNSGGGVISRIKLEFGYHAFVSKEHGFWAFWKPSSTEEGAVNHASDELKARLREVGYTKSPSFGIKITIDKNHLNGGDPYKADLQEFTAKWQGEAYDMLIDAIVDNQLPVNEWFWGRVEKKVNPYNLAKGEAGKTARDQNGDPAYPTFWLPVEKYPDEATARSNVTIRSDTNGAVVISPYSATAMATYGDVATMDSLADQVIKAFEAAKSGTAFNNDPNGYPLPSPPTPDNLKKYIAGIYQIEPGDIDLLANVSPF